MATVTISQARVRTQVKLGGEPSVVNPPSVETGLSHLPGGLARRSRLRGRTDAERARARADPDSTSDPHRALLAAGHVMAGRRHVQCDTTIG